MQKIETPRKQKEKKSLLAYLSLVVHHPESIS